MTWIKVANVVASSLRKKSVRSYPWHISSFIIYGRPM